MNDFDPIPPPTLPPPVGPPRLPPSPPPSPPRKRRSGCLTGSLIAIAIVGLLVMTSVILAVVQNLTGGGDLLPRRVDDMKDIHEDVVMRGTTAKKLVIISINGIIMPGTGKSRDNSPSDNIIRQLRKAGSDDRVAAVILDMNTPGGAVTATDEIHHEMQKLRQRGIILLTCMRTIAASGGYYLAAGTDYIVANRLTLTGSIGVIIGGYNYHGLFDRIGLQSEVYKSGKHKDILNMGRVREAEETALIQALVDETYHEFALIVSEGREIALEDVKNGPIGDAAIFSGRQAKELGLVDELGYLEDAIERAGEMADAVDAQVVRYTQEPSLSDLLLSLMHESLPEMLPGSPGLIKKGRPYYLCPTVL